MLPFIPVFTTLAAEVFSVVTVSGVFVSLLSFSSSDSSLLDSLSSFDFWSEDLFSPSIVTVLGTALVEFVLVSLSLSLESSLLPLSKASSVKG